MKATELISRLTELIDAHGDLSVAAFPGWDSAFIIERDYVNFCGDGYKTPHFFIQGGSEEA